MLLTIKLEREDDGRWIASVPELRGVLVYGQDQADAERKVHILVLQVIADQIEHGELGECLEISYRRDLSHVP